MSYHKIDRVEVYWSINFQLYFKNYDFSEYVKNFEPFREKIDILSVTAELKFESKNPFEHIWHMLLWLSTTQHISFLLNRF